MPRDTDEQLHRILEKLDHRASEGLIRLDTKSARFVAENVERWAKRGPFRFSDAQRAWIESLEEQHL